MADLLRGQSDMSPQTPLPVRRMDDASTINTATDETVTWFFVDTGVWASATGEAAGTIITADLLYDAITNSMGTAGGHSQDTSLSLGAATRLDALIDVPELVFTEMTFMSPADQAVHIAKWLVTNGQYAVDHGRGQIWGMPKDTVADDTATYKYRTPLSGGGTGDKVDLIKVGGTSTVSGGVAGSLGVGGTTADGAVDAGNPVGIGGLALAAQRAAVAAAGRVKAVFNLFGEIVIAGYTWATNSIRTEEIDPLDQKYLDVNLADTTNVSAATHYYPASTGATMDGYKDQSMTGKFIDADGTLTLTLEVSNDEDPATADWNGAYFYDDELNSTVSSKTVTNGTELFSLSVNNNNFRLYRWVVIASGATNTVILKERKKAL